MNSIGKRLNVERTRLGLTQLELAKQTGIQPRTQIRYEVDATLPDAGYLSKISALGMDISFIVTGTRAPWIIDPDLLRDIISICIRALDWCSETSFSSRDRAEMITLALHRVMQMDSANGKPPPKEAVLHVVQGMAAAFVNGARHVIEKGQSTKK